MNSEKPSQSRSEREIFSEALTKATPAERAVFLDLACGQDAALRSRLEQLLSNHFGSDSFMANPLADIVTAIPAAAVTEAPGSIIGRYKLLQKIGEGGCGVVYMAEQEQPVRRRVALKVIKLGMDTKSVIARFEAERQALAMMDHPNIARVLDAGATDSGRPYFVMELVKGIKITQYCDQNNLPTRERLTLFTQVCQAIQHAHQKGIIHRDIKPSNILVTLHDGVPVPKIIDFGIAKATDQRLTDKTLFTQFEALIGTPAYMSPEQAEMSGLDIDTRSDIYSLGVLLYELLTGKTPFDAKSLVAAGLQEMRRTIRESEPLRPSTCLSTMLVADLTITAKHRQTEPVKLTHLVRGDLDWIVMKALEKDRARRYETANGFAADVKRYLSNEPVLARSPSAAYRLQKAIRRNKVTYTAAAAVVLALAIGFGATWRALIHERVARREAIEQKEVAQKRLSAATQFAREILSGVTPKFQDLLGGTDGLALLLASSSRFLDALSTDRIDDPRFLKTYIQLLAYQSLVQGSVVIGAGETDVTSAIDSARASLRLATNLVQLSAGNSDYASLTAFSYYALGEALLGAGRLDEARQNLQAAFDEFSSLSDPRMFQVRRRLGFLCYKEKQYNKALVLLSKWAEDFAGSGIGLAEEFRLLLVAENLELQGLCYSKLGNIEAAIPLFLEALASTEKAHELIPNNSRCPRDIGGYNSCLGELKMSKGDYAESSRHFALGLNGLETLHQRDPSNGAILVKLLDSQFRAARSFAKVASGQFFTSGERAEAQQQAEKALNRCRELIQLAEVSQLLSSLDFRPGELDVITEQLRPASEGGVIGGQADGVRSFHSGLRHEWVIE